MREPNSCTTPEGRESKVKHQFPAVDILGMPVHKISMSELLDLCERAIAERLNLTLGMINAAKIVNCRNDSQLHQSVLAADVIAPDGQAVVWLSRLIGHPLPERIAGIDVMLRLLERSSQKHYRVYCLGAKPAVVEKVVEVVRRDYPGVEVVGYRDGYFSSEQEEEVALSVKTSRPDIIFVAISPPKKEIFLGKWGDFMGVPVCHGVGGSFDVVAGATKRAPAWMQKCGMEWFYRFMQEPRRMWKRYLVTNTMFLWLSVVEIIRHRMGLQSKSEGC